MELPLSVEQVLRGIHHAPEYSLPENEVQVRTKPRASGLLSDAREVAYAMAGFPVSDPPEDRDDRRDGKFTQEQGRLAEDITVAGIGASGLVRVVNRQISLPDDFFVTGHPDGELEYYRATAGSGMQMSAGWFPTNDQGLKVGFEHKHYGRYAYTKIAKDGLVGGAPDLMAQIVLYGAALGWDACYVVITAQDASSVRFELRNKGIKDVNPKMMVFMVDLREHYDTIPLLQKRAEWFTQWATTDGNPRNVAIEAKMSKVTKTAFPWGWSDYVSQAMADGQSGERAPTPPFVRDWV